MTQPTTPETPADAGTPVTFEGMESTNIMDAWRFKRD